MATTVENLSWTAVASHSWITVSPTAGTGSQDVQITITPSTIVGDPDTAGTVTFTCLDCSPPAIKVVNVTRCAPTECEYESTGTTTYTFQDLTVGPCDTSIDFNVPSITKYKSTNGCADKDVPGSVPVNLVFEKNQTTESRVVGDMSDMYRVTQTAGPCTSCGCGQINLSNTSLSWDWDNTDEQTVTFTIDSDCTSLITVTGVTATGNFTAYLSGNSIKVKPTGTAPGTTPNTGSVTISYNNNGSKDCPSAISLAQSSQGCDCTKLTLSKTSVSVNAGSSDTVTVTPNCATDITVESSDTTKATASYENDTITINGVANGSATITVKYKAGDNPNCSKDITVNVGCPTITISSSANKIPCEGETITFTKTIS